MKFLNIKSTQILCALFLFIFSSCTMQKAAVSNLSKRGKVLKEYAQEEEYYMVIKEGNEVVKYRLYNWASGLSYATVITKVYSVETITQECYTGFSNGLPDKIDCEKLKKDQDLNEFISW